MALEGAIPSLWSAVHGWFTPAVLFVLVNLVIGTIAVTSKAASGGGGGGAGGGDGGGHRKLSRMPSLALDRLRSFDLSRFTVPAAPLAGGSDPCPPQPAEKGGHQQEREREREHEHEHEHEHAHMERSRSEGAAETEAPRLLARMRKSASEKSAFEHFEAEEAVETRRPARAREVEAGWVSIADEEVPGEEGREVDARADDFINRFRQQLMLQRLHSIMRRGGVGSK